jgi:hypothetical protein
MKKITRRKISFPTYNTHFFVYFPLWAPSTSNLITFFFVIHFKQFKVLYKRHLKFYKSFLNFNSNRTTYKEIFGCSQTDLCNVWWFVFLSYWPHLRWGAVTFSMFFFFLTIFSVPNCANKRGSSFVWTLKTMEPSPWIQPTLNT